MKFKQNIITIIIKKEGWKCNRHVTVKASNSIKECTYSYVGPDIIGGDFGKRFIFRAHYNWTFCSVWLAPIRAIFKTHIFLFLKLKTT